MKKNAIILFLSCSLFLIFGCEGNQQTETTAEEATTEETGEDMVEDGGYVEESDELESGTYTTSVDQSAIGWFGSKKFTDKKHNGTVQLSSGSFEVEDGEIVGGEFTIDMSTIQNNDLDDNESKAKLVGHLKSEDFFEVETYPTATFVNISSSPYEGEGSYTHQISGDLTIKDVTEQVSFPVDVEEIGGKLKITGTFTFNRAAYNVEYGSESFFPNLIKEGKDKIINDEIEIALNVTAEPSSM